MNVETERKKYERPLVIGYGRVDRLTMGSGGSCLDGNSQNPINSNQVGGGQTPGCGASG